MMRQFSASLRTLIRPDIDNPEVTAVAVGDESNRSTVVDLGAGIV